MQRSPLPVEDSNAGVSACRKTSCAPDFLSWSLWEGERSGMTERPWEAGQTGLPRDISALYSQAQLKTARYRDFSASRRQVREQFGQRERIAQFPADSKQEAELAPRDEVQPTRRWYALNSVLFPSQEPAAPVGEPEKGGDPPITVVVSAAGGAGKTCLVATLGRALAALGEQVLLADRSPCGLLPFYFASSEIKPGVVRTFASPVQAGQQDAPVRLLSLVAARHGEEREDEPLAEQLQRHMRDASRLLLDAGPSYLGLPGSLQSLRPMVLAPILPDMSSLACLASLENLLGGGGEIYYLLNQFDASLPLHLDVRAMLQQQLGSRLLPLVLHRSPAVSEALAEGMTVIDYAPGIEVAEDYRQLAAWLRSVSIPAPVSHGSLRWTER
jgi:cellulose synthase operon protein YhjQ